MSLDRLKELVRKRQQLVVWDAAQRGKSLRSRLEQITTQHHALGLTLQHPIRKGPVDGTEREHSRPLRLEVDVLHVHELVAITQNDRDRPLDWRLDETELTFRLTCQLRLCESGVCVLPLADLFLLFMSQFTNLFWSGRHRCCASKASDEALQLELC
uniref:AlNc14C379G11205 protein n=1 Tax=Albugo laibachii Nc14 TaxID=890382 RepID=F0WYE5_9STRA|nr:AlNc14C379G11205 [Albugo laibachii Nc14]|eukprot:CCA26498.1 AlNc14C379G11205 [Albugo laibachii Nc14]